MPDGPPLACRTARRLLAALLLRFVLDAVAHVANPPARCLSSSQLIRLAAAGKYSPSRCDSSPVSPALCVGPKGPVPPVLLSPSPDDSPGDTVFCPSLGRPWAHRLEFGIVVSGRPVRSFFFSGVASPCGASRRSYGRGAENCSCTFVRHVLRSRLPLVRRAAASYVADASARTT